MKIGGWKLLYKRQAIPQDPIALVRDRRRVATDSARGEPPNIHDEYYEGHHNGPGPHDGDEEEVLPARSRGRVLGLVVRRGLVGARGRIRVRVVGGGGSTVVMRHDGPVCIQSRSCGVRIWGSWWP
jgi:hypothetical protein